MREVRTEIQILAPIERVWQVLTDFENWKTWNPTVKQVNGSSSLGSKLDVIMSGKDCKEMAYHPYVLEAVPPKSFRWRAKMIAEFLFTNDRVFELRENAGGTIFYHREEFSGLMVPMIWKRLNQFVLPTLEKMNAALKIKLETSKE